MRVPNANFRLRAASPSVYLRPPLASFGRPDDLVGVNEDPNFTYIDDCETHFYRSTHPPIKTMVKPRASGSAYTSTGFCVRMSCLSTE